MKQTYKDIVSRISEPPTWWDHNGVPRYGDFHPDLSPDIYADECVLFLIRCQNCQREFNVELSRSEHDLGWKGDPLESLEECIPEIFYGDPPNVGCCPSGPTMTSESIRILQFWKRERFDWIRMKEHEVDLADLEATLA